MEIPSSDGDERERLREYAFRRLYKKHIGSGNDGIVWMTTEDTVVKVFHRYDTYLREREAYQRLRETGTTRVAGFDIPQWVWHDDTTAILEMTAVFPPFLLDFGKAYVDNPPDFTPEVLQEWELEHSQRFEPGEWSEITVAILALRKIGIYWYDASPGNVMFSS